MRADLSDDGLYQCQVGPTSTTGPLLSDMVSLTVMVESEVPRIVQGEEMEVMAGKEVLLECQAKGRPEPGVTIRIF